MARLRPLRSAGVCDELEKGGLDSRPPGSVILREKDRGDGSIPLRDDPEGEPVWG